MLNALHRLHIRLVFVALFALGFAQAGALAHGYSHDAAVRANSTHQAGFASHDGCNDCIAYAAVLSAAGAPADTPPLTAARLGVALNPAADSRHADLLLLAFRSRAPPGAR